MSLMSDRGKEILSFLFFLLDTYLESKIILLGEYFCLHEYLCF
jgi:hypothetical protein